MTAAAVTLREAFATPGKKLVIYVTAGDPSLEATTDIVVAAAEAGADVIELGMPFSDPSADGPAIQAAMGRALAQGATPLRTLEVVRAVRARGCTVPIVLFGYYNPVFVHGPERFCRAAADAGAQALLLVDLPVDETGELAPAARAAGLDIIPLLAPTSSPERIARVTALEAPFVYYVSMAGTTGVALRGRDDLPARVAAIKAAVKVPVAVGFGIVTADDVRAVASVADAVAVGSAVVRAIEKAPGDPARAVASLVAELRSGLKTA